MNKVFWKRKLKILFYTLLGIATFGSIVSYQILWQYGTEVLRLDSPTACNIPFIDPHSKSAKILIEVSGKIEGSPPCIGAEIKFRIEYQNFSLVKNNPDSNYWKTVTCCYTVFKKGPGRTLIHGAECFPVQNEYTPIPFGHFNLDVKCRDTQTNQTVYRDQFPVFRIDPEIESSVDEIYSKISKFQSSTQESPSEKPLSVLILGLDSVSHQNLVRYMPKSYDFLMNDLSALEFFGFNKVGRGTIENVIGMLSGCKVLNPLDPPFVVEDHCELLWQYYAAKGYRTLSLEDHGFNEGSLYPSIRRSRPGIGTHYNMSDFAFAILKIEETERQKGIEDGFGCFENQFVIDVFAQVIVEVAKQFAGKPYLNFVWLANTVHKVMSNTKYMDEPVHRILSELNQLQLLNDTVVVVVADHGPWHGAYMATEAGALERLMPAFFVAFPKSFKTKYSHAYQNMKLNTRRLTTQYDLFQTLLELSDLQQIKNEVLKQRKRNPDVKQTQLGQSLFMPVPLDRTCETANISPEFCMCWSRSNIYSPESTEEVQQATAYALIHLNSELQLFPLCAHPLTLKDIKTANWLGSRFDLSSESAKNNEFLEVTFSTYPANAEFIATVTFYPTIKLIGQVIRSNIYKGQSDCIGSWANASYAKTMCLCSES